MALVAGEVATLKPGIRRLIAPNPGLMTGPGTNTYLLGNENVAVIDPGPRIDRHIAAIITAAAAPIRWILVTHTHPDHSPAAVRLAAETGAELLGIDAPAGPHQDATFRADRRLSNGDRLTTDEFELLALHTPGHASNHLCFLEQAHQWLFTGDHIMNGSTVVIDPPDGNMSHYLESLQSLKSMPIAAIAPGHGAPMHEPMAEIDALIAHRLKREHKVAERLAGLPDATLTELVVAVYDEVDPRLHRLAERSLLAHLEKFETDGLVQLRDGRWRLLADVGRAGQDQAD